MWKETAIPIELPRYQRGVDYGRARAVLIQKGNRAVVVTPGHNVWSGIGMPWGYAPAEVSLVEVDGGSSSFGSSKRVFEGRITKAKMAEAAPKIAAWLGVAVEDLPAIDRRKSFVWED